MNRNLKVGLVLMIIASVFFLCTTLAFYILREAEKEKRLYLEEELEGVLEAKRLLAEDLGEIKIINRDLESKLGSARQEAERIAEELQKEKEAKELIVSKLEEEKKKTDTLMVDIMKEKEERLDILHKLAKAEETYNELKEEYDLMVKAKERLQEKIKRMMAQKGVELERIEVRGSTEEDITEEDITREEVEDVMQFAEEDVASEETEDPDADVLVVNRKFDFIVANLGKLDGADLGTELDVYRDGEFIAKTKIEKLYDNMSAAAILPEWKDANIKEGDQIYFAR